MNDGTGHVSAPAAARPIDAVPWAPGGEGFLGHNREFREERLPMLDRFAASREPIFRLRLPIPGFHALVVNAPETVQEQIGRASCRERVCQYV